ncbi:MAG: hypothetical protein GEU87_13995 [Alphaproteobacteria bacterium]|nr:hypothetical protein [Alphaproteobacteria bacterium]
MWSLFNKRRDLDAEVYGKLRPGDLYGADDRMGRPPELFVRYLLLGNASLLAFAAVVLARIAGEAPAQEEFRAAVWLTSIGMAITAVAWLMLRLSRTGEARAISRNIGNVAASEPLPAVQALMKKAAIKKMLAFRLMIVSALSGFIAVYAGVKGLFML